MAITPIGIKVSTNVLFDINFYYCDYIFLNLQITCSLLESTAFQLPVLLLTTLTAA